MSSIPMTSSIDNLPLKTNINTSDSDDVIVNEIIDYVKEEEDNVDKPKKHVVIRGEQAPIVEPPKPTQSSMLLSSYYDNNLIVLSALIVISIIIIQQTDYLNMLIEYSKLDYLLNNRLFVQYAVIYIIIYILIQKNNMYK